MTSRDLLVPLCLSLLLAGAARAADHGATASALKVLTSHDQGNAGDTHAAAPARESHLVQKSETLDMFIRRQYAGWPFKEEVFRRTLADLNPSVLPNAANSLLKRGSTLVLPTTEDLRRSVQQHYPKGAELVRIRVEVETEEMTSRNGHLSGPAGPDKRRWVRFP